VIFIFRVLKLPISEYSSSKAIIVITNVIDPLLIKVSFDLDPNPMDAHHRLINVLNTCSL